MEIIKEDSIEKDDYFSRKGSLIFQTFPSFNRQILKDNQAVVNIEQQVISQGLELKGTPDNN